MKGWVGLVGWPTADGLPTYMVTHQLQVERRTGKVRRSKTDVLPTVPRNQPYGIYTYGIRIINRMDNKDLDLLNMTWRNGNWLIGL